MDLQRQLEQYHPWNEQEERDKSVMLALLAIQPDIFTRENQTAHMTASAWIVNKSRSRILMVYHNLYRFWSWTGGHADGERDLAAVAVREAMEETGVSNITLVDKEIFSVEVLTVDGHEKKGAYVPSHLHLNVTYLLEADESEALRVRPDENSGVAWFTQEEAIEACAEPWMTERIYRKLMAKVRERDAGQQGETAAAGEKSGMRTKNQISDETIEYVGILAKLELDGAEKERAKQDMAEMLDYIDRLNELDTGDVEPMSHVFPVSNVFREDVVTNGDGSADTLANAPQQKDGGFQVPKTIA